MSEVLKLNMGTKKKLKAVIPEAIIDENGNESYDSFYEENSIKQELENRFKIGYDTGFKAAQDEMEKSFATQLTEQSGQFYNILSTFEENLSKYESGFDSLVIGVTKKVCKKILDRELTTESIIEKSLKEASSKVIGASDVKIKLNPADLEKMKTLESQLSINANFSKINFEADESIEVGGCIVDSEIGNVDARISGQLNEIMKSLENNLIKDEL